MGDNRSFASEVRSELAGHISHGKHCCKAELRAIFEGSRRGDTFGIISNDPMVIKKSVILIKKIYSLEPEIRESNYETHVSLATGGSRVRQDLLRESVLEKNCCRRAYLRGWFLVAGTVTDPEGHYHLEINAKSDEDAVSLREVMSGFDLEPKLSHRKNHPIVYLKEGQKVVDFLNIVGAHVALMEFENARIVKEVRGRVNRRVNCETANIKKTISASAKQVEDIRFLIENVGEDGLSERLLGIAKARLENPEATLIELGGMMEPPLGKSAVNHRLRRLSEMAENLRGQE